MEGAARGQDDLCSCGWAMAWRGYFLSTANYIGVRSEAQAKLDICGYPALPEESFPSIPPAAWKMRLAKRALRRHGAGCIRLTAMPKRSRLRLQRFLPGQQPATREPSRYGTIRRRFLSDVIVNISVLLDPSMIVLGGEIGTLR